MWPTDPNWGSLIKTHLDAPGDSPSSGRAQLEAIADRLNAVQAVLEQIVEHGAPITGPECSSLAARRPSIIKSSCLVYQYGAARTYTYPGSGMAEWAVGGVDRYVACCACKDSSFTQERSTMVINGRRRYCVKQTVVAPTPAVWPSTLARWWGITQPIEAINMLGLQQDGPITLSFWFQASAAGLYAAALFPHLDASRVTQVFEVFQANTPQRVVVQFPVAPNVPGEAVYTTTDGGARGPGWTVFVGAVSASYGHAETLGQRNADPEKAGAVSHASVVDWSKTAGGYIALTGLQIDEGLVANPVYREPSYDEELLRCQRYYYVMQHRASGPDVAAGLNSRVTINFPTAMRDVPTVTLGAGSQATLDSDIGTTGARFYRTSAFVEVAPGTVFDAEIT